MDPFRLAAKAFILDARGQLLLLKRRLDDPHKPGIWEVPGGRLELGEDPAEGLRREVREETGLGIDIFHPLRVHRFTRDDGQVITMLSFLCRARAGDVRLSAEHTAFEWVPEGRVREQLDIHFHPQWDVYERFFKGKLS